MEVDFIIIIFSHNFYPLQSSSALQAEVSRETMALLLDDDGDGNGEAQPSTRIIDENDDDRKAADSDDDMEDDDEWEELDAEPASKHSTESRPKMLMVAGKPMLPSDITDQHLLMMSMDELEAYSLHNAGSG